MFDRIISKFDRFFEKIDRKISFFDGIIGFFDRIVRFITAGASPRPTLKIHIEPYQGRTTMLTSLPLT